MNELERLPNIGKMLASELNGAGIETATELDELGSVRVALRLEANGTSVCSNKLYALDGAIRGVRWHVIPRRERDDLRARFEGALRDESG